MIKLPKQVKLCINTTPMEDLIITILAMRLEWHQGNISHVAKTLRVDRTTVYGWLSRHQHHPKLKRWRHRTSQKGLVGN